MNNRYKQIKALTETLENISNKLIGRTSLSDSEKDKLRIEYHNTKNEIIRLKLNNS